MKVRWGMVWLAVAALGCGVIAAALVVSRLSDQQLAALAGAVCGAGLALPLGAAGGAVAWSAHRASYHAGQTNRSTVPPVIYVTTTPAPPTPIEAIGPSRPIGLVDGQSVSRRAFNVIGGEELNEA